MPEEEEEYELTPHKELEDLKKEIERLKGKSPKSPKSDRSSDDLLEAVDRLTEKINDLIELFKGAEEEMGAAGVGDETRKLNEKLDKLADENRKMAESLVSLAEIVKRGAYRAPEPGHEYTAPRPLRAPPRVSPPPFIPPRPHGGSPTVPPPIAPPRPPEEEEHSERKGLFDRFKK